MSNKRLNSVERFAWAFLQSLWVGGIWVTLLVIFPTLNKSILAPILVYNVIAEMEPRIIFIVAICVALQMCLFIKASEFILLFKTAVGLGVFLVFTLSIAFLAMHYWQLLDYKLRGILYIAIALLGFFLTFHLPPWLQKHRGIE